MVTTAWTIVPPLVAAARAITIEVTAWATIVPALVTTARAVAVEVAARSTSGIPIVPVVAALTVLPITGIAAFTVIAITGVTAGAATITLPPVLTAAETTTGVTARIASGVRVPVLTALRSIIRAAVLPAFAAGALGSSVPALTVASVAAVPVIAITGVTTLTVATFAVASVAAVAIITSGPAIPIPVWATVSAHTAVSIGATVTAWVTTLATALGVGALTSVPRTLTIIFWGIHYQIVPQSLGMCAEGAKNFHKLHNLRRNQFRNLAVSLLRLAVGVLNIKVPQVSKC